MRCVKTFCKSRERFAVLLTFEGKINMVLGRTSALQLINSNRAVISYHVKISTYILTSFELWKQETLPIALLK